MAGAGEDGPKRLGSASNVQVASGETLTEFGPPSVVPDWNHSTGRAAWRHVGGGMLYGADRPHTRPLGLSQKGAS